MTLPKFNKNLEFYHRLVDSIETRPELLTDYLTPNDRFFVCNAVDAPLVDVNEYRLRIHGDGVRQALELSYEEIKSLPRHDLVCYLECAGNHRELFDRIKGEPVLAAEDGFGMTEWTTGGVGNAKWGGVSLHVLLEMAGLDTAAVHVNAKGLDTEAAEGGVSRPIPLDKALDPDTLVAWSMNDEPLPVDNGFPLRLIVPGWVGTNSIKWLGELVVSMSPVSVSRNTEHYVLIGPEWPADGEVLGEVITEQNIKSSLALQWNATLPAGRNIIHGNARSPFAPIANVQWSVDEGASWSEASLVSENTRYSWCLFEFECEATPGEHGILTRANDTQGNTQPMTIPFNKEGYLFNQVFSHPVSVS